MGNQAGSSVSGRNSFTSSQRNSSADECQICLGTANAVGGGVPLISPGCCGKFYHQSCLHDLIGNGITTCPNCRTQFSQGLINAAPRAPAPGQMQQQQQQQQQLPTGLPPLPALPHQQTTNMSFLNSMPSKKEKKNKTWLGSSPSSNEDLLDENPGMIKKLFGADKEAAKNAPTDTSSITITAIPERSEISLAASDQFFANVSIKASEAAASAASTRLPMDIVCVLDNSGSMQGSKIESLRVAMKFVRSQMNANDRLAIVSFNSTASVVHGLLKMETTKSGQSDALCDAITAGGGTSIYSGMHEAVNILDARRTKNQLSCIFLLTDGQDGSNRDEKRQLGQSMRAKGYTLSVFGFGADHDAEQLQMIANAAEATFSYVAQDDMVVDAFGGAMGGAQGTVATNLQVTISLPASSSSATTSGLSIVTVNAGQYSCILQPNGSYLVTYANIFAGEQRDIIVQMVVPAVSTGIAAVPLLLASATYSTVDGQARQAIPNSEHAVDVDRQASVCVVKRDAEPTNNEVNVAVDVQVNRFKALQAMKQAMSSADRGDYQRSNAVLKKCISDMKSSPAFAVKSPVINSAIDDLEEALTNTASAHEYNSIGGKATMCENMNSHDAQRKMYNKASKAHNPYQCMSSASMQSSACEYKSKSKSGFFS
jgi:Mg-chelatase subunit ChlD